MLCVCVYMSVFQGCICDCSGNNTMLNSIVMLKWMCRRLIRERTRESMRVRLYCMCENVLCVCVCLCLKWVMNCHVFEWKAIHHPHHWLWGPVITGFPSFTLLMIISFDQPLCLCCLTISLSLSDSNFNFETEVDVWFSQFSSNSHWLCSLFTFFPMQKQSNTPQHAEGGDLTVLGHDQSWSVHNPLFVKIATFN